MKPWGHVARLACLACGLCACTVAPAARVLPPDGGIREEAALVPTRSEEETRRASVISHALARSIASMPGIESAQVHVALPVAPAFARTVTGKPRASVLVHAAQPRTRIDLVAIQTLVAGAVPDLDGSAVSIVVVAPPAVRRGAGPPWVRVGPWEVTPSSATSLRGTVAGLLLAQVVLALALAALVARQRSRREGAPTDGDA